MMENEDIFGEFYCEFNGVMHLVHMNAVDKGFWDEGVQSWETILLNMMGEIAELWEDIRSGKSPLGTPSEKIPEFSIGEEELADLVIRIMDTCQAHNMRLPEAILAKHEYNTQRPFRHGKTC